MDIVDRLNDPKLYVDAIDDAINEIVFLRGRVAQLEATQLHLQPGAALPVIEVISDRGIDPDLLSDLEAQLLSAELDDQGNPRVVRHSNGNHAAIADEETIQMLDTEWNRVTGQ